MPLKSKGSSGNTGLEATTKGSSHSVEQEQKTQRRNTVLGSGPTCAYCKHQGHLLSECWALEKKKQLRSANAMDTTMGQTSCTDVVHNATSTFKPFLSQGFISVCENDSNKRPIQILQDTGASQSLLLEDVLPLSEQSATSNPWRICQCDSPQRVFEVRSCVWLCHCWGPPNFACGRCKSAFG